MPELPDVEIYVEALRERIVARALRAGPDSRAVPAAFDRAAPGCGLRQGGARGAPRGKAHRGGTGGRPVAGAAPDDRRTPALAGRRAKAPKNALAAFEFTSGSLMLTEAGSQHRASLHVAAGEEGLRALDAGGMEVMAAGADGVRRGAAPGEPYAEAGAHRSAPVQRHRQRLLGRDSAPRALSPVALTAAAERRGNRAPVRSHASGAGGVGGAAARARPAARSRKR